MRPRLGGTIFDLFARARRHVLFPRRASVEQRRDKVNAIINCHLLTGRIGRPGWGRFADQPAQCHGRAQKNGLANQLAHMDSNRRTSIACVVSEKRRA